MDEMDERENYREMIMENIEYDVLVNRDNADRLDESWKSCWMLSAPRNPTVRINGEDMSQQVVKSRFLKLNSSHIEYVFETLQKNPSDIRNIRSYLLTTLYNAIPDDGQLLHGSCQSRYGKVVTVGKSFRLIFMPERRCISFSALIRAVYRLSRRQHQLFSGKEVFNARGSINEDRCNRNSRRQDQCRSAG
jgi:hypothetical protein